MNGMAEAIILNCFMLNCRSNFLTILSTKNDLFNANAMPVFESYYKEKSSASL